MELRYCYGVATCALSLHYRNWTILEFQEDNLDT